MFVIKLNESWNSIQENAATQKVSTAQYQMMVLEFHTFFAHSMYFGSGMLKSCKKIDLHQHPAPIDFEAFFFLSYLSTQIKMVKRPLFLFRFYFFLSSICKLLNEILLTIIQSDDWQYRQ